MYHDNVPPEALVLDEFLKNQKLAKDSKGDFNVEKATSNLARTKMRIDNCFPPD